MFKKLLFGILLLTTVIAFSITYSFAANNDSMLQNAANGVRNVVGGAENSIENAARDVSNTSKNVTGDMENGMRDMTNTDGNQGNNNDNSTIGASMNLNSGDYTAARTSTFNNNNGMFGMNSTTWIWLIMAMVAVAIIALVYYYSAGLTNQNHYDDGNE